MMEEMLLPLVSERFRNEPKYRKDIYVLSTRCPDDGFWVCMCLK